MKKRRKPRPCRPDVRASLDRQVGDDGWMKRRVLVADSLIRLGGLSCIFAEDLVSEAYTRIIEGRRQLHQMWEMDLDGAVTRLVDRTVSSLVYIERRRQRRQVSLGTDDERDGNELVDTRQPDIDPKSLMGLFPGTGFVDEVGRRVLDQQGRQAIADELGFKVGRVYKAVCKNAKPRIMDALAP